MLGNKIVDAFLRGKMASALDFKDVLRELNNYKYKKLLFKHLILDQVNKFVKNSISGTVNPRPIVGGRILAPGDGKAGGGTVQPKDNQPLVGERGPELFVPNTSSGSYKK